MLIYSHDVAQTAVEYAAGVHGRTAARNLGWAGMPRSAAMKLTGHKTETVYRRYTTTDSVMLKEAIAKLALLHGAEEGR